MEQGAGKMFSKTAENELCEQLKYCEKQSLMQWLTTFSGFKANHIDKQGEWRRIIQGTASTWTRSIYLSKDLCMAVWKRHSQNWYQQDICLLNQQTLPKNWYKEKQTKEIMLACPFCDSQVEGKTEHLHMYCMNIHLTSTWHMMNRYIKMVLKIYMHMQQIMNFKMTTLHKK